MKHFGWVVILLLLMGCAPDGGRPTLTFDTTDLSAEQEAAFYEAQDYWEAEFSDSTLFEPGPPYNSIVHFVKLRLPLSGRTFNFHGGSEIHFSTQWPNWGTYACVRSVSKHELGHSIGLNHSSDPSDPMYYMVNCSN